MNCYKVTHIAIKQHIVHQNSIDCIKTAEIASKQHRLQQNSMNSDKPAVYGVPMILIFRELTT